MEHTFDIIIPARYGSSRLPGKPLLKLGDKPLIQWVIEQAVQSRAEQVIVATDDERIAAASLHAGAEVAMTVLNHRCGTERLAEAAEQFGLDDGRVVVNLQGYEPLMPPALIDQVAELLFASPEAVISTACEPISSPEEFMDSNIVKVVVDQEGRALYFSRAPIPFERDRPQSEATGCHGKRHIGIYGYRVGYLKTFAARTPSELEQLEKLEQLRALDHGETIVVAEACERPGPGIDTPEDLERLNAALSG
ncbi:MAG: 3-deoxy-manno-octulosonate cytidylyltransferase [Arenicellales bacterium]|nr:3-deoxy-manno-octulosonate cytidylyltransferase [Arenicellales bacterium]